MACVIAAEAAAEVATENTNVFFLVEVGLGGRLDCANALDTRLAICTHLSRDHCHVLGNTVRQIAVEKLAIARPDAPLFIGPQNEVGHDAAVYTEVICREKRLISSDELPASCTLAMSGDHQRENAATAFCAAQILLPDTDPHQFLTGISTATLVARSQRVRTDHFDLLIDGAHNGPSIAATVAVAASELPSGYSVILGLAQDKEFDEILPHLRDLPVITCGYYGPRARGANDWPGAPTSWQHVAGIKEALELLRAEHAQSGAGPGPIPA